MTNNKILNYSTCSTNQMIPLSLIYKVIAHFLIPEHLNAKSANDLSAHLSQRLIGGFIGYPWSGVRRLVRPQFQTSSPLKPLGQLKQILCGASLASGEESSYNGPGHMAMPIYREKKTLKNLLLKNQKSYNLDTWHVATWTQTLQSLYK